MPQGLDELLNPIGVPGINILFLAMINFFFILSHMASKLFHQEIKSFNTWFDINPPGIILCMGPANERWCYTVTPSLIGWAYTQNDPWLS